MVRDDRARRVLRVVAVVLTVALAGVACGGGDEGAEAPELTVLDGFTVPGARSVAAYLTIRNDGGPDAILGASLTGPDAGRAEAISMHRTVLEDGLALMRPADRIELRAGEETALEPGRAHLMIERLREPVELGETLLLVLELERSDPIEVEITAITADEALARLRGEEP
jgi:copper(I)-binding protein